VLARSQLGRRQLAAANESPAEGERRQALEARRLDSYARWLDSNLARSQLGRRQLAAARLEHTKKGKRG
jgi:hypothetical protein